MVMLPEKERKQTDQPWIFVSVGFLFLVYAVVGYAFLKGDIYRITNGIDDCGNVCGRENKANELPHCGPSDKRDKQFTFINITKTSENITNVHLTCVPSCNDIPGYQAVSNRCLRSKDEKSTSGNNFKPSTNDKELIMMVDMMDTISEDLTASWSSIVVACFITLAMSFILLGLFRYATQSVFYLSYIGFVVTSFIASYKLFIYGLDLRHSTVPRLFSPTYVIIASILVGLIGLLSACFFCCAQKRISSVIKLYKEASKIFVDVPLIMVKPLFTFFAIGVSSVALIYFFLVIKSSGNLKTQTDSSGTFIKATYVQNAALVTAHFLNIIGYLFFVSFFYGCQNFIIACTVCQWFFSRDKKDIGAPIVRSFFLMFRFHLGSVCLGGLVITAVKIVRILTETMNRFLRSSNNCCIRSAAGCCDLSVRAMSSFFNCLVRNAYTIVSLDGTPLFPSGQKAYELMKFNLSTVVTLNTLGIFVLILGRLFVVAIAGYINYRMIADNPAVYFVWVPVVFTMFFAFLIIHCFLTVYEMIVDTIFICYSQDNKINDGVSKPYFIVPEMEKAMDELNGRRYRREVKDEGNQDDDMNGNGSTVPTAPSSDEQQIEKQEKLPFTNGDQNRESERVSPTAPPPSYQSIDSGSTQKH